MEFIWGAEISSLLGVWVLGTCRTPKGEGSRLRRMYGSELRGGDCAGVYNGCHQCAYVREASE